MLFAEKVKKLRESKGWTKTMLGDNAGTSDTLIRFIENRSRTTPQIDTVCRIAHAFGMGVDELLEGTEFDYRKEKKL